MNAFACDVLRAFYQAPLCDIPVKAIDIEAFTTSFLHCSLDYQMLSEDGTYLGLTTYTDALFPLPQENSAWSWIAKDSIVLDQSLLSSSFHISRIKGRARFTIAHECAHQLLYRQSLPNTESNANYLASCLLIPNQFLFRLMRQYHKENIFYKTNNGLSFSDEETIRAMATHLSVSFAALYHRLNEYGYIQQERR